MFSKKLASIMIPIALLFLLGTMLPTAFGDNPSASVYPTNISPDQSVSITISDNSQFSVTSVTLTGPDGTVFASTVCTNLVNCHGSSSSPVILSFGTGGNGWRVTSAGSGCAGYSSPQVGDGANTHCSGSYTISVKGVAISGTPRFTVAAGFSVPEFGMPLFLVTVLGLLVFQTMRVKLSRSRRM
ncbi:MAG: hypothetical protein JRN52_00765 [Nitrososphaerota archaeon]|nr:hypothetical protein [Nitrososphaerota archaeon]